MEAIVKEGQGRVNIGKFCTISNKTLVKLDYGW